MTRIRPILNTTQNRRQTLINILLFAEFKSQMEAGGGKCSNFARVVLACGHVFCQFPTAVNRQERFRNQN